MWESVLQTNVDGVFDMPPCEAGARLLRHIKIREGKPGL